MAELRNITNSGVVVGGDVTRSTISVGRSGPAGGAGEAELLSQLNALFTDLLAGLGELPAEQAGTVARQAVELKTALTAPERDHKRVHAVLGSLQAAVVTAAPLAEIVKDVTDLVSRLLH